MTLINGFSFSTRALAVVAFGNPTLRYKEFVGVGYEFQLGQNRQFQFHGLYIVTSTKPRTVVFF
jgi:hypothetical protein